MDKPYEYGQAILFALTGYLLLKETSTIVKVLGVVALLVAVHHLYLLAFKRR